MQRSWVVVVFGTTSVDSLLLPEGAPSPIPLPLPQHIEQAEGIREPTRHQPRRHWCAREGRRHRRHQLPDADRDHTALPAHHEEGVGALPHGCHLHRAEDPPRR